MSKKDDEIEILTDANYGLYNENRRLLIQIERLQEDNERLQAIVNEVKSLHCGTDLFTSCVAREADPLIELIEREVSDE